MELHAIDIVLHLINIAVLFILLKMWVFKPVQSFMANRQEKISNQIKEADSLHSEAYNLKQELNSKLSSVNENCEKMIMESRQKGSDDAEKIIDSAEEEARNIISQSCQAAQSQKQHIMDLAKVDMANLAVDMAARVLKFDEGVLSQVVQPREKNGNSQGTLITAAHCDKDTLADIKSMLENLLALNLNLDVKEDESLIGGFMAFVDGQVYDFSYKTQLDVMKHALS